MRIKDNRSAKSYTFSQVKAGGWFLWFDQKGGLEWIGWKLDKERAALGHKSNDGGLLYFEPEDLVVPIEVEIVILGDAP